MTTKPNWTPGPWELDDELGIYSAATFVGGNLWIAATRPMPVRISADVQIANANLIAAAPDLYADLWALVDYAKKKGIFRDDMGQGVEAHCNAALARARGES